MLTLDLNPRRVWQKPLLFLLQRLQPARNTTGPSSPGLWKGVNGRVLGCLIITRNVAYIAGFLFFIDDGGGCGMMGGRRALNIWLHVVVSAAYRREYCSHQVIPTHYVNSHHLGLQKAWNRREGGGGVWKRVVANKDKNWCEPITGLFENLCLYLLNWRQCRFKLRAGTTFTHAY